MNSEHKKHNLYIILAGVFITNAILAEMIGVKIFSMEAVMGSAPASIPLFGSMKLDFNLSAGAIIWPFVFITTDIINEYFGKKGVKKISYFTVFLLIYVFLVVWIATLLPPALFWLDINKEITGEGFNINQAFSSIFGQGLGIIVGSITAFLIGQILDVYVFQFIKERTGARFLWLRATGSTLVSQLVDSFLVLFIAFYLLGGKAQWTMDLVLSVAVINYIYKFSVAVILTPVLYFLHKVIDKYLGVGLSSGSEN